MGLTLLGSIMNPVGYVLWELTDNATGQVQLKGQSNIITNKGREQMAKTLSGQVITQPGFVGVGTGTNSPAASDTALQTVFQYDGANDAKAIDSKSIRSLYTSRFITQFTTAQANTTIREIGLFDAANGGVLWARVAVNIVKAVSQRLTIYWYVTFTRSIDVALKTGASISATGTISGATASTLTFASPVTVCIIHNNSGEELYFRINQALVGSPPDSFDFMLQDNENHFFDNEEINITTVSVYGATISGTMPINKLSVVGW
jgi:hypothetical protein